MSTSFDGFINHSATTRVAVKFPNTNVNVESAHEIFGLLAKLAANGTTFTQDALIEAANVAHKQYLHPFIDDLEFISIEITNEETDVDLFL